MNRIPAWIHLKNVPLELYTKKGLSYTASALGIPLYMDKITANFEGLAYAKICVEIEVNVDIPRYIDVHCKVFGHSDKSCMNRPMVAEARVWQPKKSKEQRAKEVKEAVPEANSKNVKLQVEPMQVAKSGPESTSERGKLRVESMQLAK
ncbi:uncharacterized protein LOC111310812 [Durio zibethinus]|uniref:Uncharacterized protein LOC111310812 n=1 Tax=Durio zibethinus TaxID=66656 RepID=A0A6P6AMA1_DURZI|nr:uncharacterized protein LOC111310812 [Durio zibethinus]